VTTKRNFVVDGKSLDVSIWELRAVEGKKRTTFNARWTVAGRQFSATFKTRALANGFRADLTSAIRRGEAFDVSTGRPDSMAPPPEPEWSWFQLACTYAEMKWADAAPKSRAGIAETLAAATVALVPASTNRPDTAVLRGTMYHWATNPARRRRDPPAQFGDAARWLEKNALPVSRLADATVLRAVLETFGRKLDGTAAAASTYRRKRAVFHNLLEYAVEIDLLPVNPLTKLSKTSRRTPAAIDPTVLIDHHRAEALLDALASQDASGRRLVAFFGCIYYAALRPSEAVALRQTALLLPDRDGDWGELHLSGSAPASGRAWTDSGQRRESRQLKHRAMGDVRRVPCHPRLVELLRAHLDEFGTTFDGRLFRGARGGPLSEGVYGRAWALARQAALTEAEAASSMAARPYDLRHACVTGWLNATGDAAQVAAWAGHSVNVLLRVYVRCVAGRDELAKQRIAEALKR
jgi:integrase